MAVYKPDRIYSLTVLTSVCMNVFSDGMNVFSVRERENEREKEKDDLV